MTNIRNASTEARLRLMWQRGESLVAIRDAIDFGATALNNYIRDLGLPARGEARAWNAWPEADLATIKQCWIKGDSASDIAARFPGRTRLAVIGVVHRQGWNLLGRKEPSLAARSLQAPAVSRSLHVGKIGDRFKPTPPKPGPQNKPGAVFGKMAASTASESATKRAEATAYGVAAIKGFLHPANDDAILLLERRFGQCSWPVGTPARPAEQLCCGQRIVGERTKSTATYCDVHRKIAAPTGVPVVRELIRSVRRAA
jgi:GcrA cell cycle regulator